VEFVVQFAETGKCMVIKTWDKDVAADLTAITNHNTGVATLSYNFKNDQVGEFLADSYVVKPFEFVPIKAESLALARNRAFFGNVLIGHNAPKSTSMTAVLITGVVTNNSIFFKTDSAYELCVIFYTKYGRKCGAVRGAKVVTPDMAYYNTAPTRVTLFSVSLSNTNAVTEIPEEAWYYRIGRTQASRTNFFLQGSLLAGGLKYVYKDATTGLLTYADTLTTTPYGVGVSVAQPIKAGLGYEYTEGSGDILKLYTSTGIIYKKNVKATDGNYVILPWDNTFTTNVSGVIGKFEIYAPKKSNASTPIYYETGGNENYYRILNPGAVNRQYGNLAPFLRGDVRMITRDISLTSTPDLQFFEAMSPNDKLWMNWLRDETKPWSVDLIGQKRLLNTIYFSNTYIPGSRVNGLSEVEPLNEYVLDSENGAIRALHLVSKVQQDGTVLLAVCEKETVSMYLGEQELFDTQGSAFVAKANSVIGNSRALQGGYGTKNPESVFSVNGLVYFFDSRNGGYVQYSNNGLFMVSKNNMARASNLFSLPQRSIIFYSKGRSNSP
jgi:hypothetical protein